MMARRLPWILAGSALPLIALACTEMVRDGQEPASEDGGREAALPEAGPPPVTNLDAGGAATSVTCPLGAKSCVVEIAASTNASFFCARLADGTVWCWGDGTKGVLGIDVEDAGGVPWRAQPVRVGAVGGVAEIAVGARTVCARQDDGGVLCWGSNNFGELGQTPAAADELSHPAPSAVAVGTTLEHLQVGEGAVCGLAAAGTMRCWGDNTDGVLMRDAGVTFTTNVGDRVIAAPGAAMPPATLGPIVDLEVRGGVALFATDAKRAVYSWGKDHDLVAGEQLGVLGRQSYFHRPDPVPERVPRVPFPAISVSASSAHACAVTGQVGRTTRPDLYCWGSNRVGQLGTGSGESSLSAVRVDLIPSLVPRAVRAADGITCLLDVSGAVFCAGGNTAGRLGIDPTVLTANTFDKRVPLEVGAVAVDVAASATATCALLATGSVVCWGSNLAGELGTGKADDAAHSSPSAVLFP